MFVQMLQSVGISVPGFAFVLRLGVAFDVAWRAKGAVSWPHTFFMAMLGPHDEPAQLTINLLALLVLWRLWRWLPVADPAKVAAEAAV
jgi:hypothetical protein